LSLLPRLLKVGSMTEALGVYVPAMIFQKALGLGRVLLFAYFLAHVQEQYGLWSLGMMIVTVGGPVATLGANHGLIRYVSAYEAAGTLGAFYRKVRWRMLLGALGVTGLALAFSGIITREVILSPAGPAGGAARAGSEPLWICWAALANVFASAVYFNALSFLIGMRAYRAVSAVEVFFSLIFTLLGLGALGLSASGLALLTAHLLSLLVAIVLCAVLTELAISHAAAPAAPETSPQGKVHLPAPGETEEVLPAVPVEPDSAQPTADGLEGAFGRLLKFGGVAMIGNLLWLLVQNISLVLTNRHFGHASAGVYRFYMQISQPVFFLGSAAWAVVFPHIVKRWEGPHRRGSLETLQISYKAIVMVLMALTVGIYATSGLWGRALPEAFRPGLTMLGGLLLFFQVFSNLAMMTMLAKLQERPLVIAGAALAGGVANVLLAWWWMPLADYGPAGAAWAAGVGMYVGAGAVAAVYFALCRIKLSVTTYLVMACPVLLVLPPSWAGLIWAAVLAAALLTPWFFDAGQKKLLGRSLRQLVGKSKGA